MAGVVGGGDTEGVARGPQGLVTVPAGASSVQLIVKDASGALVRTQALDNTRGVRAFAQLLLPCCQGFLQPRDLLLQQFPAIIIVAVQLLGALAVRVGLFLRIISAHRSFLSLVHILGAHVGLQLLCIRL